MTAYQARYGAGVETTCDTTKNTYKPRYAVSPRLIEDIEWATGKNGTTFLSQIRTHGLDIVRTEYTGHGLSHGTYRADVAL